MCDNCKCHKSVGSSQDDRLIVLIQTVDEFGHFHIIGSVKTDLAPKAISDLYRAWREEFPLFETDVPDSEFAAWLAENHGAAPAEATLALIDIA